MGYFDPTNCMHSCLFKFPCARTLGDDKQLEPSFNDEPTMTSGRLRIGLELPVRFVHGYPQLQCPSRGAMSRLWEHEPKIQNEQGLIQASGSIIKPK